jgi:hypothetical protein
MGIHTTKTIHRVASPTVYAQKHEQSIAKLRQVGDEAELVMVNQPIEARIDANRWLVDCECGGAAAASPDWPESRCFGCGRIYTHVVFPANRAEIEAELEKQSYHPMREWTPGETLEDVKKHQAELTEVRTQQKKRRVR